MRPSARYGICKWKLAGVTALWLLSVSALGVLITFTAVTYDRIDTAS